jgi:hypothetical protein
MKIFLRKLQKADKRNWNDMVEEFTALRRSSEAMFASFDKEQLEAEGNASERINILCWRSAI